MRLNKQIPEQHRIWVLFGVFLYNVPAIVVGFNKSFGLVSHKRGERNKWIADRWVKDAGGIRAMPEHEISPVLNGFVHIYGGYLFLSSLQENHLKGRFRIGAAFS